MKEQKGPKIEFDASAIKIRQLELKSKGKEKYLRDFANNIIKLRPEYVSSIIHNNRDYSYPLRFALLLSIYLDVDWKKLVKNAEEIDESEYIEALKSITIGAKDAYQ